jgi:hypothetical protein
VTFWLALSATLTQTWPGRWPDVAILVTLSVILTASVLFPATTAGQILDIAAACGAASVLAAGYAAARQLRAGTLAAAPADRAGRDNWRIPPVALLSRPAAARSACRRCGSTWAWR